MQLMYYAKIRRISKYVRNCHLYAVFKERVEFDGEIKRAACWRMTELGKHGSVTNFPLKAWSENKARSCKEQTPTQWKAQGSRDTVAHPPSPVWGSPPPAFLSYLHVFHLSFRKDDAGNGSTAKCGGGGFKIVTNRGRGWGNEWKHSSQRGMPPPLPSLMPTIDQIPSGEQRSRRNNTYLVSDRNNKFSSQ